jgi:hypothetical protein
VASQMSLLERFWSHVEEGAPDECWRWTGWINDAGYARLRLKRGALTVSRFAYELATTEPVATGVHIDHLCRNRWCVNPAHMEPVTPRENTIRGVGLSARRAAQTHCQRGHEFTPENTYRKPGRSNRPHESRECRTCRRERQRARHG